jgi:predicted RNase H-like HicB family nuclease
MVTSYDFQPRSAKDPLSNKFPPTVQAVYWATIDREYDGRFVASIPDLWDLAAHGDTDKDAVAHVTELAGERVRAAVDDGQPVPPRRHSSEMPSHIRRFKEVGRAIIPVEVGRTAAWPTPPYHMSP